MEASLSMAAKNIENEEHEKLEKEISNIDNTLTDLFVER